VEGEKEEQRQRRRKQWRSREGEPMEQCLQPTMKRKTKGIKNENQCED